MAEFLIGAAVGIVFGAALTYWPVAGLVAALKIELESKKRELADATAARPDPKPARRTMWSD